NDSITDGYARTYGKGIMQTTFILSNGGAVKLTTAVIYQPDKTTCIHNTGVRVSGANAVLSSDNRAILRAVEILAS
ncbi:MAG: S41 family peptidase, partial [Clostridia bacterium]|nr:S41 family peptidase [Clostridia bacterium]